MSRWVDAEWIKDRNSFVPKHELHTVEEFLQILDEAPAIDVVPVKTKLDEALEYIIGYCEKHPKCSDNCKFYGDDGECLFWKADSPVDWKRKDGDGDG